MNILKRNKNVYKDLAAPTFRQAFDCDNNKPVLAVETGTVNLANGHININMSSVYTKILQIAGQNSQHYTSDVLTDIDTIKRALKDSCKHNTNTTDLVLMGVRENGVDGNGYIMSNLIDSVDPNTGFTSPERNYRVVLAVEIQCELVGPGPQHEILTQPALTVTLKDITNNLYRMNISDIPTGKPVRFKNTDKNVKVWTETEIEAFLRKSYETYQRAWLYQHKIPISDIIEWSKHGETKTDLSGIKDKYNSALADVKHFREHEFLCNDYMMSILDNATDKRTYTLIMDQLYCGDLIYV